MRSIVRSGLISASLVLMALIGTPAVMAYAHNGADDTVTITSDTSGSDSISDSNDDKTTTNKSKSSSDDRKAAANTKLADAKLKVCQKREQQINNILSRISDRGQKQLDLFTSIAEKTQTFYTNKGKTLSNYDALVADVNTKKTEAQTTVDTITDTSVTFKCDGTDPKGKASSFKEQLKSETAALKAYKTSVKNLIVGVKSVQSTSADDTTGGDQ